MDSALLTTGLVLLILKLAEVISISWWFVAAPYIAYLTVYFVILLAVLSLVSKKPRKWR